MLKVKITILLFFFITGLQGFTSLSSNGKALYEQHCARCHGNDGTRGMFGAKNLQMSILPDSALILQIQNGKRIMPSFKRKFTLEEIYAVSNYIKSFRKL
jgi:cytochrome c6